MPTYHASDHIEPQVYTASNVSNCISGASTTAGGYSNWTADTYTIHMPDTIGTSINFDPYEMYVNGESLQNFIKNMIKEEDKSKTKEEEKKSMKMFNFDFGPAGSNVALSMKGMAVRNSADKYVTYDFDNDEIVDVDVFTIDTSATLFYKMPVAIKDVAIGDIIIHNKHYCFVLDADDTNTLEVVDITTGSRQTIYPTKSPFGFNFVTKIISLIDYKNASADSPFGNMLPFIMMKDGNMNDMLPFLMMNGNTSFKDMDPMMLYFLMSGKGNDMLPFLLMNKMK